MRRTWQQNNANLRPWAYGYPAKSGYTRLPIDLYVCIGCAAYDLGFDETRLDELLRFRGKASAADVLYTYDTLLEAQQTFEVVGSNTRGASAVSFLLATLGTALLLVAMTLSLLNGGVHCSEEQVSAYEQAGPYPRVAPEA